MGPVLIWKVLSETVTVVDSTLVVVPLTKRFPVIVAFPPTLRSLAIPAPPSRTNAPSDVLVLCLVLVTLIIPDQLELTAFIVPEIPTPPLTTRAPEVIPVLCVVLKMEAPPYVTKEPVVAPSTAVESKIVIPCS